LLCAFREIDAEGVARAACYLKNILKRLKSGTNTPKNDLKLAIEKLLTI
jgi:hypothetical protein